MFESSSGCADAAYTRRNRSGINLLWSLDRFVLDGSCDSLSEDTGNSTLISPRYSDLAASKLVCYGPPLARLRHVASTALRPFPIAPRACVQPLCRCRFIARIFRVL